MHNAGEMKSFCPKSCYIRPSSNLFMNVKQQPGIIYKLPYGTVPKVPRSSNKLFFGNYLYWLEDVAKIFKMPGLPGNNIVSIDLIIYCTTFQLQFTPPCQFLRHKILLKKNYVEEILIVHNIEFD